jgi:hypothetical protein
MRLKKPSAIKYNGVGADYTGLQKKYYVSVTSTKVGELNSIFYAEFKFL